MPSGRLAIPLAFVCILVLLVALPPLGVRADDGTLDVFDAYLDVPYRPADGFVDPRTKDGTPRAIAHGRVRSVYRNADGTGSIETEHFLFENHERHLVNVWTASGGPPLVSQGELVTKGQVIAEAGRAPMSVSVAVSEPLPRAMPGSQARGLTYRTVRTDAFVRERRVVFVPTGEPRLILVDHDGRRMRYLDGGRSRDFRVGLGQRAGRKRLQGDLMTPRGMYFLVAKHRGAFPGPTGPYFGGHWLKINYPNAHDAAWGLAEGHVSREQARRIERAWRRRAPTPQGTRLGGGIGFHGWIDAWSDASPYLTWGCVVMHNDDIAGWYDHVPVGTMVVLF